MAGNDVQMHVYMILRIVLRPMHFMLMENKGEQKRKRRGCGRCSGRDGGDGGGGGGGKVINGVGL
jgi:hypothetical protein